MNFKELILTQLHKSLNLESFSLYSCFKTFQAKTAVIAPKIGADIYTHKCSKCPETIAGESERIGFIDAPLIGPANIASNNTTPPIAIPANIPCSLLPLAT